MKRFAFICSLSALTLGCEIDPGTGLEPYPSDGVSGFGKSLFVDVCIGPARVSPSGETALCTLDATPHLACSQDVDCPGIERCLCGRCIVRACDGSSVCPTGEACRGGRCTIACTADSECEPGETCSGGGCSRPCQADGECHRGELCDLFGTCSSQACSAGAACGGGTSCEPITIPGEVREPDVVTVNGERVAFFEVKTASESSIYRGLLTDMVLLTADPVEPVLAAPAGQTRVGAPSAVVDGDRVELFVAQNDGESIGHAISSDGGRSFSWADGKLTATASWESGRVGSPGAFVWEGQTYLFYEGGIGEGIGLVLVENGGFERVSLEPVIRPIDLEDASFWRSVERVGTPSARVVGGTVRVYVTGRGIDTGDAQTPGGTVAPEVNDSVGMFASFDGEVFDRYPTGPVYSSIAGLLGSLGEREPSVDIGENGADLYFVSTDASGQKTSGLAHASSVK
ncbi:MAG: hypothetical protein IPK82_27350 [Polyangiaceae bacterium]|nr:hypothetical protein [Polyangiaceae bacterium]